jgi:hypothetical protein
MTADEGGVPHRRPRRGSHKRIASSLVEEEGGGREESNLTESLVRTKVSTSIVRVAPSFTFSSGFFARAIVRIWCCYGSGLME